MAVKPSGGSMAAAAAAAIFVVLFLAAAGFAIYFYSENSKLMIQAQEAQQNYDQLTGDIDLTELQPIEEAAAERDPGISVVQELFERIESLKQLLVGRTDMNVAQIREELGELDVEDNTPVTNAIKQLRSEKRAVEANLAAAQEAAERAGQEVAQLERKFEQVAQSQEQTSTQSKQRINELETEFTGYQERVTSEREAVETAVAQQRERHEQELREKDAQMRQLNEEIQRLAFQIRVLENELKGQKPEGPDLALQTDGTVVNVSDDGTVFIDLGAEDQVILGMTFEVFPEDHGALVDEDGRMRGKASIEIVSIDESSSAGRIVRMEPGSSIVAGDEVANIVYEPNKQLRFHLYPGNGFDLDYDGRTEASDLDRVASMIRRWGGSVERGDELELQTDFLVVGSVPPAPEPLTAEDRDDENKIRMHERLQRRHEQYQQMMKQANELSIPVLNQNRFLALVGYYRQ